MNIPGGLNSMCLANKIPVNPLIEWLTVSGSTLLDSSGNSLNGNLSGSPLVNNNIITFDAVNDYVMTNTTVNYNSQYLTVSIVASMSAVTSVVRTIFKTGTTLPRCRAYRHKFSTGDIVLAALYESTSDIYSKSSWNVETAVIHYLFEYDLTGNGTIKLYKNNSEIILASNTNQAPSGSNIANGQFSVGLPDAAEGSPAMYLHPKTRIYNRILTDFEKAQLYNDAFI